MRILVFALVAVVSWALPGFAQDASGDRIRQAAARAIALVQSSQANFASKIACASCHHQFQPALAFRAAREHGIAVNEEMARAVAVKAFSYADLDRAIQYTHVIEPAMDDAYRLVAADAAGVPRNLSTAVYARLIASRQNPAGDWTSFHQRPPSSYSSFTMTALGLRAIQLFSHPSQKDDAGARIARAKQWLTSHAPRDT